MVVKNLKTGLSWNVEDPDTIKRCQHELDSEGNKVYEIVEEKPKRKDKAE